MLPRSWCVVEFSASQHRSKYAPRSLLAATRLRTMLQEVSMRESPAIPQAMQQHGGIAKNAATCGRDQTTGKQDVIDKEDLAKATPNPDNRAQKLPDLSSSN